MALLTESLPYPGVVCTYYGLNVGVLHVLKPKTRAIVLRDDFFGSGLGHEDRAS